MTKRPYTPREFRDLVASFAGSDVGEIPKTRKGLITGLLNKSLGGDINRYLALTYLFTKDPTKKPSFIRSGDLEEWEWYILDMILDPEKDPETGTWLYHLAWETERAYILAASNRMWYRWFRNPPSEDAFKYPVNPQARPNRAPTKKSAEDKKNNPPPMLKVGTI